MTARDGNYAGAGVADASDIFGSETWGGAVTPGRADDGYLITTSTASNVVNQLFKNQGWYAAGSVLEVWVTSGAPSTTAPSGHTLTDYQHHVIYP